MNTAEKLSIDDVYPNLEELLPEDIQAKIPISLFEEIRNRYETLGVKYMTDTQSDDGRFVNGCMYKSSIQDALEEVVDAVFNCLVWIFKERSGQMTEGTVSMELIYRLIDVYTIIKVERINEINAGTE